MVNFSRFIFLLLVCSAFAKANSVVDYGPGAVLSELEEKGFSQLYAKFSEECPGAAVKGSLAAYPSRFCRHSAWSMWAWVVLNLHETSRDINAVKRHAATLQFALNRYQKHIEREAPYKAPYQYNDLPMLIKRDQLWEMVALSRIDESFYEGLNDQGRHYFNHLADAAKLATYKKNQRILAELVDQHSWPTISEYGKQISSNAWLIVQHADHDVGFQRRMLQQLKSLLSAKETSKPNYAYLYDRVLKNSEGKTLYGTQVTCKNQKYVPVNVVEPEGLDARRAAHDLGPIEEYLKQMHEFSGGPCGPPE